MTSDELADYLAEHEFFQDLATEHVKLLAKHGSRQHLDTDEVLFRYHEPAEQFFLVESGRITLEVAAIEGPPLELQQFGQGTVLGWSWLIAPYKWKFQARATEPTELYAFDGRAIREQCEQDPVCGYALFKRFATLMSERLEFARQKMIDEWRADNVT